MYTITRATTPAQADVKFNTEGKGRGGGYPIDRGAMPAQRGGMMLHYKDSRYTRPMTLFMESRVRFCSEHVADIFHAICVIIFEQKPNIRCPRYNLVAEYRTNVKKPLTCTQNITWVLRNG